MQEPLTSILAEDYVGDLGAVDLAELRGRRTTCTDVETGLSYLRRLTQGRLDVVKAELARRADGGKVEDLEDLIARLPDVLAAHSRTPGNGRLPAEMGTGALDPDLEQALDDIVQSSHLAKPAELNEAQLVEVERRLVGFEQQVSKLRRQLFERIDAIEDEVTRRYRTGEASVDSLLTDTP